MEGNTAAGTREEFDDARASRFLDETGFQQVGQIAAAVEALRLQAGVFGEQVRVGGFLQLVRLCVRGVLQFTGQAFKGAGNERQVEIEVLVVGGDSGEGVHCALRRLARLDGGKRLRGGLGVLMQTAEIPGSSLSSGYSRYSYGRQGLPSRARPTTHAATKPSRMQTAFFMAGMELTHYLAVRSRRCWSATTRCSRSDTRWLAAILIWHPSGSGM